MNKKVVYTILAIATLEIVFFYGSVSWMGSGSIYMWTGMIIIALVGNYFFPKMLEKYPAEYAEANRIAFTPKTKYGLYALVFAILFFITFYFILYLTRPNY